MGEVIFTSCRSGDYILKNILNEVKDPVIQEAKVYRNIDFSFKDDEVCADLLDDPINSDIFIFQSIYKGENELSPNDNLVSLLAVIRAYKEFGAKTITAVVPYISYSRQDKASMGKYEPTTVRLLADLLICAGLDNLITCHSGNQNLKGYFYGLNFYDLSPEKIILSHIKKINLQCQNSTVVIAPDRGAQYLAQAIANKLGFDYGFSLKERINYDDHKTESLHRATYMNDKHYSSAVILDNAIFSGMTISACLEGVDNYCDGDVYIFCTHADLTEELVEHLKNIKLKYNVNRVWVSRSIWCDKKSIPEWIELFDISCDIIKMVNTIRCKNK